MQMESSLYKLLSRKKEDNVKRELKIKINNLEEMQKNKNFKKFTKDFIIFIQRNEKDDFNREKLNNCMSIKNFFSNLGKQKVIFFFFLKNKPVHFIIITKIKLIFSIMRIATGKEQQINKT